MGYPERIQKLQALIQKEECQAFLVEDSVNLYYLVGVELSAGSLLVTSQGARLFVDGRYYERCRKESPFPVELSENNPLREFLSKEKFAIGFDSSHMSYKRYKELESLSSLCTWKALDNPVGKLRMIKEAGELQLLKAAGELGSQGFDHALTLLKEGVTEQEIAQEIEVFWKRRGSRGVAFDLIVAFGANSSMPHYRAGNAKLKKGDAVLIDIGVNLRNYHSDMTRVVFFEVSSHPELEKVYRIVSEAQNRALALCRPGVTVGELDRAARTYINEEGYGAQFTHSLGHGVGLEVHEFPVLRDKPPFQSVVLETGMVITIEPGIYLPGIGGVRLEDTIAIRADGYENFTNRAKSFRIKECLQPIGI